MAFCDTKGLVQDVRRYWGCRPRGSFIKPGTFGAFYCQWTRNSISEEDDRAIEEIAHIDLNAIKLSILIAIAEKPRHVRKPRRSIRFARFQSESSVESQSKRV